MIHVPFSADFFPDLGRPSNFLLVLPIVFLNQLYICCESEVLEWVSRKKKQTINATNLTKPGLRFLHTDILIW